MKQLGKLGMMLAWVWDKERFDDDIMDVMMRVAYDTAHGFHLDVVDEMMRHGGECTVREISEAIELPDSTVRVRIEDLMMLKAIKKHKPCAGDVNPDGGRPSITYSVNNDIAELWRRAKGDASSTSNNSTKRSKRSTGSSRSRKRKDSSADAAKKELPPLKKKRKGQGKLLWGG